jgi:hypothetical protein
VEKFNGKNNFELWMIGSPHGKFLLCTPWDKSLKSLIIGGKE